MRPITLRTQLLFNGLTLLLVIGFVLANSTFAKSNAPQASRPNATTTTISYQGTLSNSSGQAVNGTLPMTFKLYTVPSSGNPIWTEARSGANAVPVNNGLFNVLLGSVTPIDLNLLSQDLWLGISINGDAEMTPREKLGTVPFAAMAGMAQTVPDGSIDQTKAPKLVQSSVSNTKMASGKAIATRIPNTQNGNVTISLAEYGFTEKPTVLCSMSGAGGIDWVCHAQFYESSNSVVLWVYNHRGGEWSTTEVSWIAIGK